MARKQPELPGMAPPRIPALESLAEAYLRLRNERMGVEKKEREKRDLLLAKMQEHKVKAYEFDGKLIEIEGKEKVFVRTSKDAEDEE
jgi:hypothetical protein